MFWVHFSPNSRSNKWRQGSYESGTSCVFRLVSGPTPFGTFGHIPFFPVPRILLEHWSKAFLCPPSENKHSYDWTACPPAHPHSADSASGCNWRTERETAAPAPSCICCDCDFDRTKWECSRAFEVKVQTHSSHCLPPHLTSILLPCCFLLWCKKCLTNAYLLSLFTLLHFFFYLKCHIKF